VRILIGMPETHSDLHGNVPDNHETALLLIDVINALDFEGGEEFARRALGAAQRIDQLKRRARAAGIPVIYLNDNFGRWRSDLDALLDHCLSDGVPGEPIARLLKPALDDYVVLKPKHSGFFATALHTLLLYLGTRSLILTGFTTDQCVLFTAADAYLRDYRLLVPADCTATVAPEDAEPALRLMQRTLHVDARTGEELDLDALGTSLTGAG
jgi:nicotinamidase-related amidase